MRKRLFSILFVLGTVNVMTGCASKVDLTEQETELVASYLSSVVLRYDQNENGNKLVKLESNEEAIPTPLESASLQVTEEEKSQDSKKTQTSNGSQTPDVLGSENIANSANSERVTLESLYDLKNVSLTYKDVNEYKAYAEGNAASAVVASDGSKFYAVTFTLKNETNKDVSVNLLDKKVKLTLKTESGMWISAAHTLLDNDMNYFEGTIKAKTSRDIVALFEVKEALKLSNATFYALNDNGKAFEANIK